jgi:RNA polymerase sigma-70 factor, ECF subfamily
VVFGGPSTGHLINTPDDDEQRFRDLMAAHQSMVFSIALRILGDRSAAEEVAQDVFFELHGKLPELRSADHVLYWLRRVTAHRSIDYVRKRLRRPEVAMDWHEVPEVPDVSSTSQPPDPLLSRWLQQLVRSLPTVARAVLVLRYQEDMSPEEISRAMDMPIATVKSHLQRSLRLLREKSARAMRCEPS